MSKDLSIIALTLIADLVSALINRQKTFVGLRKAWKMFVMILPQFLMLLVFVSIFLTFVPQQTLSAFLIRQAGGLGIVAAAGIGSVALIPGPIVYPLAGMLSQSGVPLTVLAVFITTLMMVGVLTVPVEKAFFGLRLAILRNILSLIGALVIGLLVGCIL